MKNKMPLNNPYSVQDKESIILFKNSSCNYLLFTCIWKDLEYLQMFKFILAEDKTKFYFQTHILEFGWTNML